MTAEAHVMARKVGGSMVVSIPKEIVELENIMPHEIIKISVEKVRRGFRGKYKGIGTFTEEDRLKFHGE